MWGLKERLEAWAEGRRGRRLLLLGLAELPFLVGVGIALAWFWRALPFPPFPYGSNWPIYLESAHFFHDPTYPYYDFRPPGYQFLLACLGPLFGFVRAARGVGAGSGIVMLLSAALGARVLGGRWAGAAAALTVPWMRCAVGCTAWINMFPMSAALTGLAFALGALAARSRSVLAATLAGAAAVAAWKTNPFSAVAVPGVLALVLIGAMHRRWGRSLLMLAFAALAGVGVVWGNQYIVDTWRVPQTVLDNQVLKMRKDWLTLGFHGDEQADQRRVDADCAGVAPAEVSLHELLTPCSRATLMLSYHTLVDEDCLPDWRAVLLLPLVLLPAPWSRRQRWLGALRSSLASGVVLVGPALAIWVAASWVGSQDKYVLAYVPMMAMLVPVAFARVGAVVTLAAPRTRWIPGAVATVAMAAFLGLVWPHPAQLGGDRVHYDESWDVWAGRYARWVEEHVGPDDLFIDCAEFRIDMVISPVKVPYLHAPGVRDECRGWAGSPPEAAGDTWFLSQTFREVPETQPWYFESYGWELVRGPEGNDYRLWHWVGETR